MESNHEYFMHQALKQAVLALEKNEVPVGAVIVFENKIIARAHNQCEMLSDPTAHAEMIAMTQASGILSEGEGRHRGSLENTTLNVTLEPCSMCAGGIIWNKCKQLVFGAYDLKAGACGSVLNIVQHDQLNHRVETIGGVLEAESKSLLQEFFRNLRKEKR